MNHRLQQFALAALLAIVCAAQAQEATKPKAAPAKSAPAKAVAAKTAPPPAPIAVPEKVRQLEGITEYRLANGLQLLLYPDSGASTTLVNLVYRVGSRHEGAGEAGMAHLLEHLLFKGTPSVADIPKSMSARGIRFNATTSTDRTNYFASFNANPDTLAWVLTLEAERMQRSRVEAEDLAKEMPVVMNELQQGENNPGLLLRQRLQAVAYRFHPYGKPTIGTKSDVENVPIESLRRFYQTHYRPDNATLIVAGQFDEASVLQQVNERFGSLANPQASKPVTYTVEPPQDGERSVVVRRVGGSVTSVLAYHVPAFAHPDCAALSVLGQMLTQPPSGALYQRFVEKEKLASGLRAAGCGGHDPGLFQVTATPVAGVAPAQLEAALIKAFEQREGMSLSDEQFQRVKNQFALSHSQMLKMPQALAQFLTEAVAAGDWRLVFKLMAEVQALKLEDVERVAATYLQANNRTLARYEPVKASGAVEVPAVVDRQAGLDQLASAAVSEGERLDPSPLTLQERTQFVGVLPKSGVKLALLPKRTRGERVVGQIQLRWGDVQASMGAHEARFVGSLLREGNAKYTRQQLIDEQVRLKGSISISSGRNGLQMRLEGEQASFPALLQLGFDMLREPLFPAEAFERAQRDLIKGLRDSRNNPDQLRLAAVREHYNQATGAQPGDPGYQASLDDTIGWVSSVTLDQVKAFHAKHWGVGEGEAGFVGALPEGLAAQLDTLLAGWKKGEPYKRWVAPFQDVPAASFHVNAPDKASAVLSLRQEVRLNGEHADVVPLTVVNQLLGGGSLESRLNVKLRQESSLTYGAESILSMPEFGEAGHWTIRTSMAPENRDKALTLIHALIANLLKNGVSAEELERARKDLLESRRRSRSNEAGLAARIADLVENGKDWRYTESWDERYRQVTLDEVNAALRRYLRPDAWVISSAGDYEKKPPLKP